MSVAELYHIPPIIGTDISVESIRVGPTGAALNYYNTGSLSTNFGFFSGTAGNPVSLGTGTGTGTISLTAIGNQYFMNLPLFEGTLGTTGSFFISGVVLGTGFRPSTEVLAPAIIRSNASGDDDGICSIETDGHIRFYQREGSFGTFIGRCDIESQSLSYHI